MTAEWFDRGNNIIGDTLPELMSAANAPRFGETKGEPLTTFLICEAFERRYNPEEARAFHLAAMIISRVETKPAAQNAKRKPTLKVHGWVWKDRRHEDGCSYLPSYTPEQPCKRGELFALVDPEDLHDPLNLTKRHGGEAQQGEKS